MWFIRLAYLASAPNFTNGAIIFGVFDAFTPISIAGGAILLFATMEATECMPWIMGKLKGLSQVRAERGYQTLAVLEPPLPSCRMLGRKLAIGVAIW